MATEVLVNFRTASKDVVEVSTANPLPVEASMSGETAADGSGSITLGGTAQNLFGGNTPANGFAVYNPDATNTLWISLSTTAAANGQGSIPILPNGGYETPPDVKPFQAISIVGAQTAQKFTAMQW
jgi:hypothetical protein